MANQMKEIPIKKGGTPKENRDKNRFNHEGEPPGKIDAARYGGGGILQKGTSKIQAEEGDEGQRPLSAFGMKRHKRWKKREVGILLAEGRRLEREDRGTGLLGKNVP